MKLLTVFSALLLGIGASAQQDETDLDPVTVSASLQSQTSSKTGRNIVTIKGEFFDKLPIHSVDELLRYVPGVEVQQRGPMGSQSDIVIRGGTFQQVLVILDGLRLNDPNTGHFNSYIPIAPSEIERIEILKGPSSAIYGSDAVGGVINIITRTFAAKSGQDKRQFQAQATGGQYGLWALTAGGVYQKNKTAIGGGILTNNTDGQLQRGTRGYFNNTTASFSIGQQLNDNWRLSLRSSYDKRKFSAQNFYTTYVSDTAKEEVKTFWNQLQLAYAKDNNKITLDAGYKAVEDQYAFNSAITPNNNKSKLFQGLLVYEHRFTGTTSLLSAAQMQNRVIRSNDRGDHEVNQAAGLMILNQTIGQNFFISPALRLDWDERAGTELIPQINLSFRRKSFQLRGSAGKTIRQADFTERYNNYNKTFVSSGSIGNPDLQAERSFSYEAGMDYFINKTFKTSLSIFRRDQSNVIDWVTTPYSQMPRKDNLSPTGTYALASNIASVNTSGVEMDIFYTKLFTGHHALNASAGLVWLDSKTSETTPSFYISSHAKFLTNFNFDYRAGCFGVSLNGVYKHRTPQMASAIDAKVTTDCFIMNIKAEYYLFHQRLSLFGEMDNLFDNKCQDLLGSQLPGRWLMGGAKLNLGSKPDK